MWSSSLLFRTRIAKGIKTIWSNDHELVHIEIWGSKFDARTNLQLFDQEISQVKCSNNLKMAYTKRCSNSRVYFMLIFMYLTLSWQMKNCQIGQQKGITVIFNWSISFSEWFFCSNNSFSCDFLIFDISSCINFICSWTWLNVSSCFCWFD